MVGGWVYVAGLFDGEGSIGVYRQHGRPKHWQVVIRITGAYLPTLEEVMEFAGYGGIHPIKAGRGSKMVWQWGTRKKADIASFVENTLPYLKEKAEQAALVYGYCTGQLDGADAERLLKAGKAINFPAP